MKKIELRNFVQSDENLRKIETAVLQKQMESSKDSAHDLSHFYRVAYWTLKIAPTADPKLVLAAALLHDYINLPKNSPERHRASEYSALFAKDFLPNCGFTEEEVTLVTDAIRDHSFSRGAIPVSPLGKALQDADRLEAVGSIGIMRVFSTGVKIQAHYFHPEDPWAKNRKRNDAQFSVDHFFEKLLKLPASMNTEAGRREAEHRVIIMRDFLVQLGSELGEALPKELLEV